MALIRFVSLPIPNSKYREMYILTLIFHYGTQMHLVHIKHGLDKSKIGFTSDSVTVIAILIEVS